MPANPSAVDAAYYRELLRGAFEGRRLLLLGGAVDALAALGRDLVSLGAERPFLLGTHPPAGDAPDGAARHVLDASAPDLVHSMWRFEARLACLPGAARAALDAWDPERRARALGLIVMSDVREVAGRRRYARRLPRWLELEDKTRSPAFFDAVGVRRGAQAIVRAEPDVLRAAAARLDRGAGTVWAGDATPGVHGGAVFVRWVRGAGTAAEATAFFARHCERVRVMPFVEGVPCSIHGIVFGDGVAVFRPIEMLTLRRPDDGRFAYASSASYWDPPPAERERMRALARRVGEGLRAHVAYRGAFTLDGVLGESGFVPTELNPRIGAAFRHLCGRLRELPLYPLALAAQEGEDLDYCPEGLERVVLDAADAARSGGARMMVSRSWPDPVSLDVVACADGYRAARGGESPDGVLRVGSSPAGGSVVFEPTPEAVPVGPSFAGRAAGALALADAELGAGIGPLEPCKPVS